MRMSFHLTAAAVALAAVLACAAHGPRRWRAVSLRSNARVTGAQVKLGDLFDNAGPHADDVVANAPAPGTTLLFEAAWLITTAQLFRLGLGTALDRDGNPGAAAPRARSTMPS